MVKIKKTKNDTGIENKMKKSTPKTTINKIPKLKKMKRIKKPVEANHEDIKISELKSNDLAEIKLGNIEKTASKILKFNSENPKLQNQLFDEHFPVFLQISCYKIPKGYSKIYRIPLKHSLLNAESEICLIVSEIKGVKNSEHDQHKEHYQEYLSEKGVENIKNIMTFHEFRTEYETFEQKRRLADLYDVFLADSKISGKVVKKCGKIFYTKRKVPTSVNLKMTKLKEHFDKVLSKTPLHMHLKGNCYTVQMGHSKMKEEEMKENFECIKEFLEKDFPGGFDNIMGLQIFAPRVPSVPVYFSTKSGKGVEVPKMPSRRPKAYKTYRGELTTLPNAKVIVKPSGKVIVKNTANAEDDISNKKTERDETPKKVQKKVKKQKITNDADNVLNEVTEKEGTPKKMQKKVKKKKTINVEGDLLNEVTEKEDTLKKMQKTIKKKIDNAKPVVLHGKSEGKLPKTSKRKLEEPEDKKEKKEKPSKKKKILLSTESGQMEEEVILNGISLGDQVKKPSNKSKVVKGLKSNQKKKKTNVENNLNSDKSKQHIKQKKNKNVMK